MNIKFENLAKIDEILNLLKNQQTETIEKRWLNMQKSDSLGHSYQKHWDTTNSFIGTLIC